MLASRASSKLAIVAVIAISLVCPALGHAQGASASSATSADSAAPAGPAAGTIPAGTKITMQNWQDYKRFMPDGIAALFQGSYYWKMPQDVEMDVGPTIIRPLPKGYLEATGKYSSQVKLIELPGGGLSLEGYQGGIPFPNPAEPHKGWKILANLWYRYMPHLLVDTYGTGCYVDSYGSINCDADEIVYRQLSYNTDPGIPATIPGAEGKFYSEWVMTLEPEQQKYRASLTTAYSDLAKPEDRFVFSPALRRHQAVSAASRCAPSGGSDVTPDDYRFGFDSDLTQVRVEYLGQKKILALIDADLPQGKFPAGYDMPLGWPTPSWGKWQLRDADVISVSKLPSIATGYCYGKRVMYIDRAFSAALWEDLYDSNMKPWKFLGLFLRTIEVPKIGPVNVTGSQVEAFWDIQHNHSTFFSDPAGGRPFYVNDLAPREYDDVVKYTTPGGLDEIMR
jgi:Protein of unknown function (DUF1329)